ncbi:lysozyme family protein [Breoghania corrubedonensis]|uniref:Lysozyme family protein n=1 Tax=Breoghania corrubedonensis TaxID=665038 RepID=A0A2T5UPY6_9HYPH|nr:glycosyl hydrolase 108 family protein [Breoghania corrubedonensis]PTW53580.1 lysozyme family protein [Breoghania corrubedonensis]
MDRFLACHAVTSSWEGGWSNDPDDPGGPTNFGVTQKTYNAVRKKWGLPTRSVRLITRDEALKLYRENYWNPVGSPNLFPGVDLCGYDGAVNSGVRQSKKWLSRSASIADPVARVKNLCSQRLSMQRSLKTWWKFGKGWANRDADIETKGVVMAQNALRLSSGGIKAAAADEATSAANRVKSEKKKAAQAATGAALAGGGSGSAAGSDNSADLLNALSGSPYIGYAVTAAAVLLIGGLAVYAISRYIAAQHQKARAEAYATVAVTSSGAKEVIV